MAPKIEAPARMAARPGQDNRHATAAGTPIVSTPRAKGHAGATLYTVKNGDGKAFSVLVSGRDRWALEELRKAGPKGCTPIDTPAPRWAAYVHDLRSIGVQIETLHEPHEGPFPGFHGRYVLRSTVTQGRKGAAA